MATKRTFILPTGEVVSFSQNRTFMSPSGVVVSEQLISPPSSATGKSNPLMGCLGGSLSGVIS